MIGQDEYQQYDGLGLAQLVARGEVSPAELLDAALARAEAVNPKLNAIVIAMHEIARERAQEKLQGPFAGLPFLLKDIRQEYAGVSATLGCRGLRKARAERHAEMTQRWLKAGVVIFGRTNTPEFGSKAITESELWGPCRNPWHLDHTPGGSSGGAAAAVAAGIVPIAGANDGGGSIRIPAGHCGLFGLKPGRARNPGGPLQLDRMHGAVVDHVLTRSVRDSAAMLDATQGPELGSSFYIVPPERPYLEEVRSDPGRLRIGYCTRSPLETPVDPQAVQAVMHSARLLESLGHHVEEAEPQLDGRQLALDFLTMWFATCAASMAEIQRQTGCPDSDFELDTRAMAAFGRALSARQYVEGQQRWALYSHQLAEFHARYDLLLTPTMAAPPARVGEIVTPVWQQTALRVVLALGLERLLLKTDMLEQNARENLKWVPFTQLSNITGTPSMSVPLYFASCRNAAGESYELPLGVQFVAPPGGEGLLLRLAAQLEQAQPWAQRRPPL
ncbi:amidase [Solimonas aquatica]|uniref:Amidase n=1 Tax=Solimonas aquatica TaxID=489703 RepID=A0A1H9E0R2_9GAMM|nr:amidase family protein [Solimonas aquatica]SEQ19369.1 amidase [Solimonas aquatica]